MLKGTGKLTGESLYDSRLFNQSSGMDAGFGAEDEYNTYSKPLFHRGDATSSGIYRPKKSDDDIYGDADAQLAKLQDTSRFKPDKGFRGAESGSGAGPRDAPVQFEKASDRREDDSPPRRAKRRDYGSDEDSRNGSRSRNSRDDRRDGDSPPRGSSNRSPPRRRGSEKDDPFGIGDIVGSRRDSSDNKRRRRSSS